MPVSDRFLRRANVWRVSGVPRRVRTVPLQGVCVLMGYLRAAFGKLSLIGLLAFLSRFCSDPHPSLVHNWNINYYLVLSRWNATLSLELFETSCSNSLFPSHLETVYFLSHLILFSLFPPLLLCSSPSALFQHPSDPEGSHRTWKEEGQLF